MATKDYNLSFKLHADTNSISNSDSSQFINLNLNHNNKCSKIDSVHSKTISNKNDERNFHDHKSYYSHEKVNDFDWNKSKKQEQLSLKLAERSILNDSQKKDNTSAKGSTLSLHISAYENAAGEVDNSNSNTKSPVAAKSNVKNTIGVKQHFVQSSSAAMSPFEIPRQQDDTTPKTPEVMQFRASQKMFDFNNDNNNTAKAKTPLITVSRTMPSRASSRSRLSSTRSNVNNTTTNSTASFFAVKQQYVGGYDLLGDDVQKRLNSIQRRKPAKETKELKFPGYTIPAEQLNPYRRAKYLHGAGQFWAIIEIIKASPKMELPYKWITEIYYFLYNEVLDERALRNIFNADPSVFARQIFLDESEIFKVRGRNPDFYVSLLHPERDYVPAHIRDEERQFILSKFNLVLP